MERLAAAPFILAYLLSTAVAAGGVVTHAGDAADMYRLAAALGADRALMWAAPFDPCGEPWIGVLCDDVGRVTSIRAKGVGLNGSLPSDLGPLSELVYLDVGHRLAGALPRIRLPRLETLRLDGNRFTEVPRGFFVGLRALRFFSASNNTSLKEWELPRHDLRRLTNLTTFDVNNACLIGSVAHFLGGDDDDGAFPILARVSLANNMLSGSLPEKFGTEKLEYLDLSHNRLSGPIKSVAALVNMVQLRMNGNEFTGPLPDFTSFQALRVLSVAANRLTGMVPAALAQLNGLRVVSLSGNLLQGPLPEFATTVEDDVEAAAINGSFCRVDWGPCDPRVDALLSIAAAFGYPESLAATWRRNDPCARWAGVYCDDTAAAAGGGGSREITRLNLCRMGLNGTMDPAFGSLQSVVAILLSGNHISGVIPQSVAELPSLRLLDVADNVLEGTVPGFRGDVEIWADGNPKLNMTSMTTRCSPSNISEKAFHAATCVVVAILAAVLSMF
ncbi:hypothetical protein ACP70R_024670 [Stipagrostis hirtigluma subsp. patula]